MCSGIEAASIAFAPIGWEAAAFAEVDPFACAVLAHRFPTVRNLGDFTTIEANDVGAVDLVIGGTPCQDFSVAGLRAGMDGKRGQLTIEFVRLLDRIRPRWMVWENVPGVLSIDGGRAFGAFLGALGKLGYGFAFRVLDAQYFGVPQRRRRVFVVGYLGDWRRAAAVLFERASLCGDSAPSRGAREIAPARLANGTGAGGGADDNAAQARHIVAFDTTQITSPDNRANPQYGDPCHTFATGMAAPAISQTLHASRHSYGIEDTFVSHTLRGEGFDASEDGTGRGVPLIPVAFTSKDDGGDASDIAPTLRSMNYSGSHANGGGQVAIATSTVRRLTPVECERLQGFPDNYTLVPYRKKPAADAPRYRALGNSFAVPVVKWIGERIALVDAMNADA